MTDGDSPTERQIPVTLVSGFLGAGKTTLVNRMLRNADGLRLAVLVNDFGAVNIDAELIQGAVGNVVSLNNGCICCSLTGGLLAAVSGVLRWPVPPDAIIVEGSGVANPLEVARARSQTLNCNAMHRLTALSRSSTLTASTRSTERRWRWPASRS